MKIGRNDKCPCGSCKKYKYCCLIKTRDLDKKIVELTPEVPTNGNDDLQMRES